MAHRFAVERKMAEIQDESFYSLAEKLCDMEDKIEALEESVDDLEKELTAEQERTGER